MGQAITVVEKPTPRTGVVRFELNRSITGMGHRTFRTLDDAVDDRPADELGRVLLARPGVESVHVFSNEVTVTLAPSADRAGLKEAIEGLFIHYRDGVTPSLP